MTTSTAVRPKDFSPEDFLIEHKAQITKRPDVHSVWMDVSPAIAKRWLERFNWENRRIRPARVAKYAADMSSGRWIETGEPVILCKDGTFASAQHRLAAVVESGKTIPFLVIVGVPSKARKVVDSGAPKAFSDRLAAEGVKDSINIATTYRWKARYDAEMISGSGKRGGVSDARLFDLMRLQPGLADSVRSLPHLPTGFGGRGLWAWLAYEFRLADKSLAERFLGQVLTGVEIERDSNAFFLRRRLETAPRKEARGSAIVSDVVAAYAVKSWNAERRGETLSVLKWLRGEPFPTIE